MILLATTVIAKMDKFRLRQTRKQNRKTNLVKTKALRYYCLKIGNGKFIEKIDKSITSLSREMVHIVLNDKNDVEMMDEISFRLDQK